MMVRRGVLVASGVFLSAALTASGCQSTENASDDANGSAGSAGGGDALGGGDSGGATSSAGEAGTTSEPPAIPFDELEEALIEAECDWNARCSIYDFPARVPGGCPAYLRRGVQDRLARQANALQRGAARYDAAKMGACLKAFRSAQCAAAGMQAECLAAFDGAVPVGGSCMDTIDCEGAARCEGVCPGRCVPRRGLGDACESRDDCDLPLYCGATQTCEAPAGEGEACHSWGALAPGCGSGLGCRGETENATGICRPSERMPIGDACDLTIDMGCVQGGVCAKVDAERQLCVERSPSGGVCHIGLFQDSCPAGERCALTRSDWTGGVFAARCEPLPEVGESCTRAYEAGSDCVAGASCSDDSSCVQLQSVGGDCRADADCLSGNCSSAVCAVAMSCEQPPGSDCPTYSPAGELLEGFDDPASIEVWVGTDPGSTDASQVSLVHNAREGKACLGSLEATVAFATYGSRDLPIENVAALGPDRAKLDFSEYSRLHAWMKFDDPGTGNLDHLKGLWAFVTSPTAEKRLSGYDVEPFADFDWHEIVVYAPVDEPFADDVSLYGFELVVQDSAPLNGSGKPPVTVVYLDDIWLE